MPVRKMTRGEVNSEINRLRHGQPYGVESHYIYDDFLAAKLIQDTPCDLYRNRGSYLLKVFSPVAQQWEYFEIDGSPAGMSEGFCRGWYWWKTGDVVDIVSFPVVDQYNTEEKAVDRLRRLAKEACGKEYRILKKGTVYRIQKKILGLFWIDIYEKRGRDYTREFSLVDVPGVIERYRHPSQPDPQPRWEVFN